MTVTNTSSESLRSSGNKTTPVGTDGSSDMDLVFVESEDASPTKNGPSTSTNEESSTKTSAQDSPAGNDSAQNENSELDLVFVVDNTGSMSSWIRSAQQNIQRIIRDIIASEATNVRFALVAYRDHPPQDQSFVTNTHDFTSNIQDMQRWVDGMRASGGGDAPEAVADGLHDCLNLSYRPNSTKVAVVIADAPPHGLGCYSDGFPDGCPLGHDPLAIVRDMASKGITIYSVICGNFEGQAFYQGISQITGGQYVPISSAHLLAGVIVGGAQEEITLERLMRDAQQTVEEEERAARRELDDDELAARLQGMFRKKGTAGTRQTKFGGGNLPDFEEAAGHYSAARTIADVRSGRESGGGRAHLAHGTFGSGMDTVPGAATSRFSADVSDEVSYEQCKRMARKSKARKGSHTTLW